jgi:probable phosphoglycerate mutase
LTRRGIEQADVVGTRLAREISALGGRFAGRVSPLGRARETAARIARHVALEFEVEPRLKEITIGSWDGMTRYEIDMEYPGALDGSDAFDWYFRSADGETFDRACKRLQIWLSETASPTIAVSHGLTSRLLRGLFLGLSRREMLELPVPQSGYYRLCDGRADLVE